MVMAVPEDNDFLGETSSDRLLQTTHNLKWKTMYTDEKTVVCLTVITLSADLVHNNVNKTRKSINQLLEFHSF